MCSVHLTTLFLFLVATVCMTTCTLIIEVSYLVVYVDWLGTTIADHHKCHCFGNACEDTASCQCPAGGVVCIWNEGLWCLLTGENVHSPKSSSSMSLGCWCQVLSRRCWNSFHFLPLRNVLLRERSTQ